MQQAEGDLGYFVCLSGVEKKLVLTPASSMIQQKLTVARLNHAAL